MRPAQKAPENNRCLRRRCRSCRGFNEAGAKSAGKPARTFAEPRKRSCFNEAGAKSAGKPARTFAEPRKRSCFNEAGAKSAGKPDETTDKTLATRALQ